MSQSDADASEWRGTDEGGKLKEESNTYWSYPNTGATNTSGFTALPGGYRDFDGKFYGTGYRAWFWTTTEDTSSGALRRQLLYNRSDVDRYESYKGNGLSIRCVKD